MGSPTHEQPPQRSVTSSQSEAIVHCTAASGGASRDASRPASYPVLSGLASPASLEPPASSPAEPSGALPSLDPLLDGPESSPELDPLLDPVLEPELESDPDDEPVPAPEPLDPFCIDASVPSPDVSLPVTPVEFVPEHAATLAAIEQTTREPRRAERETGRASMD